MITDLCKIFAQYGSDKTFNGRQDRVCHSYSAYYNEILESRRHKKMNVLEIGIGRSPEGIPGPSLKAWRDYFTKSQIFGADINKKLMFNDVRIQTVPCDHTTPNGFKYVKPLPPMDIIIEDGLHTLKGSAVALVEMWDQLKPGGIYIIEDIKPADVAPLHALAKSYGKAVLKQFGGKYDDTVIAIWKENEA